MNRLSKLHVIVGALGIVAFVLTGQYMHWAQQHLQQMPDGPRMLHRTAHIYLLWSSLLNVVLGCYSEFSERRMVRAAQALAGLAVLVGPALLLTSFFAESDAADLARPLTRWAIYMAFAGILVHAGCTLSNRAKGRT